MKIIGAKVEWNHRWANEPELTVIVDGLPPNEVLPHDEPIWQWEESGMMWAKDPESGIIAYFLMPHTPMDDTGRHTMKGFGGALFKRRLTDGTVVQHDNCWSSRASCLPFSAVGVRLLFPEWSEITALGGYALDIKTARALVKEHLPGVKIAPKLNTGLAAGEVSWHPSTDPKVVRKPAQEEM